MAEGEETPPSEAAETEERKQLRPYRRLVGVIFPLRASPEDELAGLDISLHGEALQ